VTAPVIAKTSPTPVPLAKPVAPPLAKPVPPPAKPVAVAPPVAPPVEKKPVEVSPPPASAATAQVCPGCGTKWVTGSSFCHDCGFMGNPISAAPANGNAAPTPAPRPAMTTAGVRIKSQYELVELLHERSGVARFRGLDHGTGKPTPVIILRGEVPEMSAVLLDEVEEVVPVEENDEEFMPTFEGPSSPPPVAAVGSAWPSLAWEQALLENAKHPSLPIVIDSFVEEKYEYLVEEIPAGQGLWDVWTESDAATRYGYLKQIAEGLAALHDAGAIVEGLKPELVTVSDKGKAVLWDLSDVLPMPVPAHAPIQCTLYTAPELVLNPTSADARRICTASER